MGGLLLFSTKGSPYVTALQYETLTPSSAHFSYVTDKKGKRMQVRSAGIVAVIPFPDSSKTISPTQAEAMISMTEAYADQHPQHSKLLRSAVELWKRKLETSKIDESQSSSAPLVSITTSTKPKIVSDGVKSEIPLIKTKSGQTLKNVLITRFEDDMAVISNDEGIGRILISDIANLSALPAVAKAAIENAQTIIEDRAKMSETEPNVARQEESDKSNSGSENRNYGEDEKISSSAGVQGEGAILAIPDAETSVSESD
jgi:hypothetical protein